VKTIQEPPQLLKIVRKPLHRFRVASGTAEDGHRDGILVDVHAEVKRYGVQHGGLSAGVSATEIACGSGYRAQRELTHVSARG
jgi:hypothetical protein